MALTGKQRAYLRKLSQSSKPMLIIGKEGDRETTYQSLDDLLRVYELVKVSLLKTCTIPTRDMAESAALKLHAEVVSVVGHRFVLYRFSPEQAKKGKQIILNVK